MNILWESCITLPRWTRSFRLIGQLHQSTGVIVQTEKIGRATNQINPLWGQCGQSRPWTSLAYTVAVDRILHDWWIATAFTEYRMREPASLRCQFYDLYYGFKIMQNVERNSPEIAWHDRPHWCHWLRNKRIGCWVWCQFCPCIVLHNSLDTICIPSHAIVVRCLHTNIRRCHWRWFSVRHGRCRNHRYRNPMAH